jgi:hypothetical protein
MSADMARQRASKERTHIPNPWDPRPAPEKGDPSEDDTFRAVGQALSRWEKLENQLATIFATTIRGRPGAAARRAYGIVQASSTRTDMILAAATTRFEGRRTYHLVMPDLKDLLKLVKDYAPRRNEIAHGVVYRYSTYRGDALGYCLFPGYYTTKKRSLDNKPSYIYSSVEINYFSERFLELGPKASSVIMSLLALGA